MSLLPLLFGDFDSVVPAKRPRRLDWLEECMQPSSSLSLTTNSIFELQNYLNNLRAAVNDNTDSKLKSDDEKVHVNFDVKHFKPEEIAVKINEDNRTVTIEAEHEEKRDEHGHIYRHFVRKYTLPKNCNINEVKSKLSSDGVLSITAPKLDRKRKHEEQRSIPIIQTGQPAKTIQNKTGKNDGENMDVQTY